MRLGYLCAAVLAAATDAADVVTYNMTVVNACASDDVDVELCLCGRGTDECGSLGYVRAGANATFHDLRWHEFTYPDGTVCYDDVRLRAGSANPPEPFFPYAACALDNAAMGRVWVAAVDGATPTLTLRRTDAYNCTLAT